MQIFEGRGCIDKVIYKHVGKIRWRVLWNWSALITNHLSQEGAHIILTDWRGLRVLFTTINGIPGRGVYWRKGNSVSINKIIKGWHRNVGRLKGGGGFTEEKVDPWASRNSTKVYTAIGYNDGKSIKIWFQVPNNSFVIIVFIYWWIFRGRENGNKSSSVNRISLVDNQRAVYTLPLNIIKIIIICFLPFVISGRIWRWIEFTFRSWSVIIIVTEEVLIWENDHNIQR